MKNKLLVVWGEHLDQKTYDSYIPLLEYFDISFLIPETGSKKINEHGMPVQYGKTNTDQVENIFSFDQNIKRFALKFNQKEFISFDEYVKDIDIIHSEETYRWTTKQVLARKKDFNYKVVLTVWENVPFIKGKRIMYEIGNLAFSNLQKVKRGDDIYYKSEREFIKSNVDRFIATSERSKEALMIEGYDGQKIHVVMPPTNTEIFRPREKDLTLLNELNIPKSNILITSIARLVWEKGVYEFVYAAYLLTRIKNIKNLSFLLIARGELEYQIKELIKTLGLKDEIVFITDPIPHAELSRYYNITDIFTLNSIPAPFWQEQIGQVMLEAMASGNSVIAAQSGSIPEVVGDAAVLTQPGDFHDLAENIEKLINNKELMQKYSKAGIERVRNNFTIEVISKKLQKAFDI